MSTSHKSTGPIAVVMPPKTNKALLTFCRALHDSLLNNPAFPSPNPKLAVFAANIDAFDEAETKAATRAKGAATLRDAKKKKLKEDLAGREAARPLAASIANGRCSPRTTRCSASRSRAVSGP